MEPAPPALEAQRPNPWTAREAPVHPGLISSPRHPTSAAQRFTCMDHIRRQSASAAGGSPRISSPTACGDRLRRASNEARGQGTGKFTEGRPRRGDGRRDEKLDFRGDITSGPAWWGRGADPAAEGPDSPSGGKGTSCQMLWPLSRFLEKRSQAPFPLKSGKPGRASSPALTSASALRG